MVTVPVRRPGATGSEHASLALSCRWEASERANCSTVQMNSNFLSALKAPAFVQIDTTITKKGRQMIFAHAILRVGDDPVMEVSGVWRVFTKR